MFDDDFGSVTYHFLFSKAKKHCCCVLGSYVLLVRVLFPDSLANESDRIFVVLRVFHHGRILVLVGRLPEGTWRPPPFVSRLSLYGHLPLVSKCYWQIWWRGVFRSCWLVVFAFFDVCCVVQNPVINGFCALWFHIPNLHHT